MTSGSSTDSRRGELIRIAGDVFARAGYSRTSLRDVAEAAGILTGSLYHHFPSKEALAIELVSAYHADIDALAARPELAAADPLDRLPEFAARVAEVVERHMAAVQMCKYDAPTTATALGELVRRDLAGLDHRWAALLEDARDAGRLRPEVDLTTLRVVLRNRVFDLALPEVVALSGQVRALCSVLLDGIAAVPVDPLSLDGSEPAGVAAQIIQAWSERAVDSHRRGQILAVSAREFARRGYEATTVRDIAQAVDIRPSSLYRHFASKQDILDAVMERFSRELLVGYEAVGQASGTPLQRLDALLGLMAAAAARFGAEFVVTKDWWRTLDRHVGDAPPADNAARLRLLEGLVAEGVAAGEFRAPVDPAATTLALRSVMWVRLDETDTDIDAEAVARRHRFLRGSVLGGAAVREGRAVSLPS